ncbi:MAG TPA: plastocyanin/azurin family copper-binding protein [Amaricoccus sp.]|nr:plastocyanin/azurin family copper-binding protein [Amaricoccus sp.]
MKLTRRRALLLGGGLAAGLLVPAASRAAQTVTIRMRGDARGAHVGFDPVGLRLQPGDTVRWLNVDPGNAHTATAYAPANFDRPRRIPAAAQAWDSDYLLDEESFTVTLTAEGIYDYYCVPHEHAGMVGRLIVGDPAADPWIDASGAAGDLPEVALAAFPTVAAIMERGIVPGEGWA